MPDPTLCVYAAGSISRLVQLLLLVLSAGQLISSSGKDQRTCLGRDISGICRGVTGRVWDVRSVGELSTIRLSSCLLCTGVGVV